jgi:hypothetical protein
MVVQKQWKERERTLLFSCFPCFLTRSTDSIFLFSLPRSTIMKSETDTHTQSPRSSASSYDFSILYTLKSYNRISFLFLPYQLLLFDWFPFDCTICYFLLVNPNHQNNSLTPTKHSRSQTPSTRLIQMTQSDPVNLKKRWQKQFILMIVSQEWEETETRSCWTRHLIDDTCLSIVNRTHITNTKQLI